MRRPAVVEIRQRLVGSRTQFDNHFLELADRQHVVQELDRLRAIQAAGGQLRGQGALKPITVDGAAGNERGREVRPGIA